MLTSFFGWLFGFDKKIEILEHQLDNLSEMCSKTSGENIFMRLELENMRAEKNMLLEKLFDYSGINQRIVVTSNSSTGLVNPVPIIQRGNWNRTKASLESQAREEYFEKKRQEAEKKILEQQMAEAEKGIVEVQEEKESLN